MAVTLETPKLVTVQTGQSQALNIATPFGAAATVIIDTIPEVGEVRLADGITVVTPAMVLTPAELAGLIYFGGDLNASGQAPTAFSYTVFEAGMSAMGSVQLATTSTNGASYFTGYLGDNNGDDPRIWQINPDGTISVTADFIPGAQQAAPDHFTAFQNAIYYVEGPVYQQNFLHRLDPDGTVTQVSAFSLGTNSFVDLLELVVFNDELYFRADNGTDGMELYRVNASGVVELASDINGAGSSNPRGFTEFNDAMYFQADNGTDGVELYRVTAVGAVEQVMNISPSANSAPMNFTEFNGHLYFIADNGTAGFEMYRVTPAGAVEALAEVATGAISGVQVNDRFSVPTEFNGALYFAGTDGSDGDFGYELYRVTSANAIELVSDINAISDQGSNPENFTEFNGNLYFSANDGIAGRELYRVNDTGAVEFVADLNTGSAGGDPDEFTEFNGALYFGGRSAEYGSELYRITFDGQVELVTDLNPGTLNAYIDDLTVVGDSLYFEATVSGVGDELYRVNSDGAVELVADTNTATYGGFTDGYSSQLDADFTEYEGELYFRGYFGSLDGSGSQDSGLFRITAAGAIEQVTFANSDFVFGPQEFTVFNDELYFDAYTEQDGRELYRMDSSGEVALVSDIRSGTDQYGPLGSGPDFYTEFNGALYFEARTNSSGNELHRVTSTGAVEMVIEINPGAVGTDIREFSVFNDALYFGATDGSGYDLYRVGQAGEVSLLSNLNTESDFSNFEGGFGEFNGALYFLAANDEGGSNIHRVTSAGALEQVAGDVTGLHDEFFDAQTFTEFNGALYFEGTDATNGTELFRINSAGAVELAADITPGAGSTGRLDGFTVFNGAMYFRAEDTSGTIGRELYRVTSTGTVELVMDFNPGTGDSGSNHGSPNEFTEFNGYLYFDAISDSVGRELYRINSSGNVEFVIDINAGAGNGSPTNYHVFNNALYLTIDNGTSGGELYRVDTAGNVNLVAELNSDTYGFFPTNFFVPEAPDLDGTAGNDIINGSNAGEEIRPGEGNDTVNGNGGNDVIYNAGGANTLNGGDGDDIIFVGSGTTVFDGGDGNDTLSNEPNGYLYTLNMITGVTNYTGETAVNFENYLGGYAVDTITGTDGANRITTFAGSDVINGGGGDDWLDGGADNDTINGEAGNDTLFATAGTDTFNGGADIDTYYIDGTSEQGVFHVIDLTIGNTDNYGNSFFLIENFVGGDVDDVFMMATTGNVANRLDGRAGVDTLFGGAGDDFIIGGAGGDIIDGGGGTDRLSYITSLGVTLDLTNSANNTGDAAGDTISTIEEIEGSNYADILRGDGLSNTFFGLDGDDTLSGLGGADILNGGAGNDMIDGGDVADVLFGGDGNDAITGGEGGDFASGGAGNDHFLIDGVGDIAVGLETMSGGDGYDSIVIAPGAFSGSRIDLRGSNLTSIEQIFFDNGLTDIHVQIDAAQIGTGLIASNANIRSAGDGGPAVEIHMGSSTIVDIGSWTFTDWYSSDDEIIFNGDSDAEVMGGSRARDIMLVDGGDFVNGRGGDDVFFIAHGADYVSTDTIQGGDGLDVIAFVDVGVDAYDMRGAVMTGIEALASANASAGDGITVTLNAAQVATMGLEGLLGNSGNPVSVETYIFNMEALTSFSVNDFQFQNWTDGSDRIVINGDTDSELILGSDVADTLNGNGGNDSLYGYGGADILMGGVNNDVLWGGDGIDTMTGGAGNDTYIIEQSGDIVIENVSEGTDTVYAFVDYVMAENVEIAVGFAVGATNITGNAVDNVIVSSSTTGTSNLSGGGGNDTIYMQSATYATGGAGNDSFVLGNIGNVAVGGADNDVYIVQAIGNTIIEDAAGGIDTVYSSLADFTLSANIETLVLVGVNGNGTGNAQANTLIGNGGNNNLLGMDGADFIIGGAGNDFITGGTGGDVMQGNAGLDTYVYFGANELGDTIQDWVAADDGFLFNAAAFGFVAGGSLTDGVNFFTDTGPAFALASFIWDSVNTALYYDADGVGATGAVLVADLQAFTDVTIADFAFV